MVWVGMCVVVVGMVESNSQLLVISISFPQVQLSQENPQDRLTPSSPFIHSVSSRSSLKPRRLLRKSLYRSPFASPVADPQRIRLLSRPFSPDISSATAVARTRKTTLRPRSRRNSCRLLSAGQWTTSQSDSHLFSVRFASANKYREREGGELYLCSSKARRLRNEAVANSLNPQTTNPKLQTTKQETETRKEKRLTLPQSPRLKNGRKSVLPPRKKLRIKNPPSNLSFLPSSLFFPCLNIPSYTDVLSGPVKISSRKCAVKS